MMRSNYGRHLVAAIKIVCITLVFCSGLYPALILGLGWMVVPESAQGSPIRDDQGTVIGSRLIAQGFSQPRYLWPRPSAVGYNAAASGGSNLSPTNPLLSERAKSLLELYGASPQNPLPAELVTASGSGLDPEISLAAAKYQSARIAAARGLPLQTVDQLLVDQAYRPSGLWTQPPLVNVLMVNTALDRLDP